MRSPRLPLLFTLLCFGGCHSEADPVQPPNYNATAPTGTGNWQPAPEGVAAVQSPDTQLVPTLPGITWETDWTRALGRATQEQKPILLLMTRPQCPNTTLLAEQVLAAPEMLSILAKQVVPVALNIDVIDTKDIAQRAGKPTLGGAELADNDQRLALKKALYDASPRDPRQPPFLGMVDGTGKVVKAESGLRTGPEILALLKAGSLTELPDALSTPTNLPPRVPAGRIVSAYQQVDQGGWPTGNGAAGEAKNGAGMSNLTDPFPIVGKTHGLAGFSVAFGGKGRSAIGQIVVSGGGTGNETMNFTNPPLLVDWSNSGEGIQYYQPNIGPDVEDTQYANGGNFITVTSSSSTDTISIVGCPPAHRWYNGTVRVGTHPMGVAIGYTADTSYAWVASPVDGTLAAVFLDLPNGEKMGDRTGDTTYFDAATGARLDHRPASAQLIDSEGRGGGQTGFGKIPGEPGPVSSDGASLAPEDIVLVQGNGWQKDGKAWLLVTNTASDTVSVFDVAPFFHGQSDRLYLVGSYSGIEHPRKIHWIGNQYAWVSSNPGNTISRLRLDTLPTIDDTLTETYPVGKNPMNIHDLAAWWNQGLVFVTNSGDNTVSVLREDGSLVGTLNSTNGAPLSEPYGVWGSLDGLRVIVSNRKGEYATYWNIRRRYEGWDLKSLQDVIVSSGLIKTGPGVTELSGYYIP